MTEQQIQTKRIKELEAEGYYVIKLTVTNKNGIPDLIAIPHGSKVLFSEIKKPRGKLSALQKYRQFVNDLLHPAGTKMFGEFTQTSNVSVGTSVASNVSTNTSAFTFDSIAITFDSSNHTFDAF